MSAALQYLSRMTEQLFEQTMRRAANKISAHQTYFPHNV